MLLDGVLDNLLHSLIPVINLVPFLVHFSEYLILLLTPCNDFINLIISWNLAVLVVLLIIGISSVILPDQVFESLLSLHVTGLIIEHSSLNDLIIEILL